MKAIKIIAAFIVLVSLYELIMAVMNKSIIYSVVFLVIGGFGYWLFMLKGQKEKEEQNARRES